MKAIVLIGLSGVGKSVKGKKLAKKLNFDFLDTDELIIEKNKMSIEDIFIRFGEEYFRKEEKEVFKRALTKKNCVISTGGGIILNEDNITLMRSEAVVFFLHDTLDNICNNLKNSHIKRPLLNTKGDLYSQLSNMFILREKLYINACHFKIDLTNKNDETIFNEIIDNYKTFNLLDIWLTDIIF